MTNFFEKTTGLFAASKTTSKDGMIYNESKLLSNLKANTKLINDRNSEIIDVAELRAIILNVKQGEI